MDSYDNKRTQVALGKIVSSLAQLRPAAARHSVQAQLSNMGNARSGKATAELKTLELQ